MQKKNATLRILKKKPVKNSKTEKNQRTFSPLEELPLALDLLSFDDSLKLRFFGILNNKPKLII